ncbi:MAG: alpha/beta hydrolase-fold protein, partial [Candidatus Latescibacteria bacterium]|nr:alpha/beta hydrolase-fold protein [Candidatus Latescibacterota bacterium]
MIKYILCCALFLSPVTFLGGSRAMASLKFELSLSPIVSNTPLTGRMFLIITRSESPEPRLQVARYGPQILGVDVEQLTPGKSVVIDDRTLGYPIKTLEDLPAGEYYIQGVFNKYTRFNRSDGHVLWMHMDQWEGQNWRRSPGNFFSEVQKITLDPKKKQTIQVQATQVIPPIGIPEDTKWVKRIKIQSDMLTTFWGHPVFIGATVLLPEGYEQHPDVYYPTVYEQGHFSLRSPFRFERDENLTASWKGHNFPRFIAITIQHPTPYFDDSYAVNTANNGPYGDAIHQELIPEIERRFRVIREPYARVLTGGSTGGWESFALQVFYPDFYGGTWSFAPDPLDFRNVEGINIYEDVNAFYKVHDWYTVPTANTRFHTNGEVRLTSEQRNSMELTHGTKGRSGQQLDIWSAVHGPVGDDGYFKPLFNKRTGEIDAEVAQYWKENYDLRYHLE